MPGVLRRSGPRLCYCCLGQEDSDGLASNRFGTLLLQNIQITLDGETDPLMGPAWQNPDHKKFSTIRPVSTRSSPKKH